MLEYSTGNQTVDAMASIQLTVKPQIIAGLFQFSYGWIEIRPRTDRDLEP